MHSFILSEEALEFVDRFYTSFALIARFPLLGMSKPHHQDDLVMALALACWRERIGHRNSNPNIRLPGF